MEQVLNFLREREAQIINELIEFANIPSLSADSSYQADCARAAAWVAAQFERVGMEHVQLLPTRANSVVYADWLHAPGQPTVLVYGHYDVQPADPLDLWKSPPFAAEVRDERVYGRGVSDDKGPMLIPIKVAEAFMALEGRLPINVKFLIEGNEEAGEPGFEQFLPAHKDLFAADFVMSADGAMWRINEPSINIASRGLAGLELTITASKKDLHSGRYGGAVANPLHALARLLATLHHDDGRVAINGFYDAVKEISPEERAAIAALPFDEEEYRASLEVPELFGEPGYSAVERIWIRPTVEVNGMWGGYTGEGGKTVIPSQAHAKITCRLVAAQDPYIIQNQLLRHLENHLPPGVRLSVKLDETGAYPYLLASDHVGLQVAVAALTEACGMPPVKVWMGGTLPISEMFQRLLGMETIFFSFSTADEDYHSPNEFFRLKRLREGLQAWALYWAKLAEVKA